jgi:hypothetical protein
MSEHFIACPSSGQVSESRIGTRDRDYVRVVDLAEGHVRALQHVMAVERSVNTSEAPETWTMFM